MNEQPAAITPVCITYDTHAVKKKNKGKTLRLSISSQKRGCDQSAQPSLSLRDSVEQLGPFPGREAETHIKPQAGREELSAWTGKAVWLPAPRLGVGPSAPGARPA